MINKTRFPILITSALVLIGLSIIALGIGPTALSPATVIHALSTGASDDPTIHAILFSIRLPRILLAVLVGSGLAVAGAVMQGLFRNPLADPGLLGVSSGAALAAVAIIVLGNSFLSEFVHLLGTAALPLAAFIGSLCTTVLVYKLSRMGGRLHIATMLLAGIAINALTGALIGVLVYMADDSQLRSLTFWQMGSLGRASWSEVGVSAAIIIPVTLLLLRLSRALNAMVLGEDEAQYLGINTDMLTRFAIVLCACLVGAAVAVSGMIGFIGLVVPHLLRLVLGPDHRGVLPGSLCVGGSLLVIADTCARTLVAPAELPIGLLTAAIGAPFFMYLLLQQRRKAIL